MSKGDLTPGKTVVIRFNTHKADGTPITLAGTPAVSVYKNSTTESTTGITLTVDYDSRTGLHHVAIDTSADGTFYAAGNDFDVVITTGTVDSISVVGTVVGSFSLSNRSALRPTTADQTLDVSAGGEAGIDWANIGNKTNANTFSGSIIASVSGAVGSVTGAVGSVTGAVGSVTGGVGGDVAGNVGGKVLGGGSGSITGDGVKASSVSGNIGGNVAGSVGSVTGNVGGDVAGKVLGGGSGVISGDGVRAASVTGDVEGGVLGSVAGNVEGNVGGSVLGSVASVVGAVGSVTGTVALSSSERNSIATALLTLANGIETGWTLQQTIRVMAAVLDGKVSGNPGSPVFRSITDGKNRVSATTDTDGNRTAVTLDGT